MEKESSEAKQTENSESEKQKSKKTPVVDSFREISGLGIKVMALISVFAFFIQMINGVLWQIALMRSITSYVILLILYYITLLFVTIIKRSSTEKKGEASKMH